MGLAGQVFQQMLQSMESTLVEWWFKAIEDSPADLSVLSCPFLDFNDKIYPAINNGEWPSLIVDREGLFSSLLLDMVNGHLRGSCGVIACSPQSPNSIISI
jgi:hypothetical protein